MNRVILATKTIALLLGLLTSVGCGISATAVRETMEAEVRPAMATEAMGTAVAEIETRAAATQTEEPATQVVAFISHHGRFVTAMGGGGSWLLRQELGLDDDCGWFTLQHLRNGKVSLKTCHGRYVTALRTGATRKDWVLWQESELSDCGKFVLHERNDSIAFETCAEHFFTAGDDSWEPDLEWLIIAETPTILDWELFTVLRR